MTPAQRAVTRTKPRRGFSVRGVTVSISIRRKATSTCVRQPAGPLRDYEFVFHVEIQSGLRTRSIRRADPVHGVLRPTPSAPALVFRAMDLVGYLAKWWRDPLCGTEFRRQSEGKGDPCVCNRFGSVLGDGLQR